MHYSELNKALGNPDIYLLDQILKGRFENVQNLLDAGCGEGRNLKYFVNNGVAVTGLDTNPLAVRMVKMMFGSSHRWDVGNIEELPYENNCYDAVVCSAVLHFAKDQRQFESMFNELCRVLSPGGILFCRMAMTIGVKSGLRQDHFTFLAEPALISQLVEQQSLTMLEPLKSVVVGEKRSMGLLVAQKASEQ